MFPDSTTQISRNGLNTKIDTFLRFLFRHLNEIVPDRLQEVREVGGIVNVDLGRLKWEPTKDVSSKKLVVVANLLASRVLYGFYRDAYRCNAVKQNIRSKLVTLHVSLREPAKIIRRKIKTKCWSVRNTRKVVGIQN